MLLFMAEWCSSCLAEARALAQICREFGPQGFQVIAIDVETHRDQTPTGAVYRSGAGGAVYPWASDLTGPVLQAFQVRYLDTTMVVDNGGEGVYGDDTVTPIRGLEASGIAGGIWARRQARMLLKFPCSDAGVLSLSTRGHAVGRDARTAKLRASSGPSGTVQTGRAKGPSWRAVGVPSAVRVDIPDRPGAAGLAVPPRPLSHTLRSLGAGVSLTGPLYASIARANGAIRWVLMSASLGLLCAASVPLWALLFSLARPGLRRQQARPGGCRSWEAVFQRPARLQGAPSLCPLLAYYLHAWWVALRQWPRRDCWRGRGLPARAANSRGVDSHPRPGQVTDLHLVFRCGVVRALGSSHAVSKWLPFVPAIPWSWFWAR